ncbi:Hypothetical protein FKW44_005114 [Caligus rogercresseyi]|uniref:Uncharacterized protein n=1 Tax=Caligus rogercresseyi TaxID=217165 RepID=A0A7T8KBH0_CALRO|nr:Hypothetical protein FKW44_005114 [Caligus rogercresseyi]
MSRLGFFDYNNNSNKNRGSSYQRRKVQLNPNDNPDVLAHNSEDDELEYDHWPGQIDLVSVMTTSSVTTKEEDDAESELDDLNLQSMIDSSSSLNDGQINDNFEYPW